MSTSDETGSEAAEAAKATEASPEGAEVSAEAAGASAPAGAAIAADAADLDGDVIPRLKRGKGIRLNSTDLFRIAAVAILLVGIIMLQRPCADGVAQFVTQVGAVDAGPASESDGGPDLGELRMLTDQEIRDVFDGKGVDKLLERDADAGSPDAR